MIVLEDKFLLERLTAFLLISVRLSAMMVSAPVFSAGPVTTPIRVALALSITLAIFSSVKVPQIDLVSVAGLVAIAMEILIGVAVGLLFQLAFAVVAMAGEQIAFSMGLGFASMVDPQTGAQSPVITQFLSIMLVLLFLAVDGHHVLLKQLVASYAALPIGSGFSPQMLIGVVRSAAFVFSAAFIIALPIVMALFCVNVIVGLLTRVAPQMNIFSIGFPLTILVGLVLLLLALPEISNGLGGLLNVAADLVRDVVLADPGR